MFNCSVNMVFHYQTSEARVILQELETAITGVFLMRCLSKPLYHLLPPSAFNYVEAQLFDFLFCSKYHDRAIS